ncbi:MAG: hypothetical protein Q8Q62_06330 [Mesorhizobium sp.]|nr:hypothetical protein [Mesorhizobium sp.]
MTMAATDFHDNADLARRRRTDERDSRLLLCALYPLCLTLAIAARLMPRGKRLGSVFPGNRSVFAEARIAAASCIPFIFR